MALLQEQKFPFFLKLHQKMYQKFLIYLRIVVQKNCCNACGLIPGIGKKVPKRKTIRAPKVNKSLCLNSVAFPNAPKFKLFVSLSVAVAIYFFVNLILPPNFSKTAIAFFEA